VHLLLVRHGESICGVKGIVGGARGCTGLTERGFAQARALRDRLVAERFSPDVILASTLPRAFQTAEVIAEPLGLDILHDADLCEFVPGEIDGTPWDDWERFDPGLEPDRPISPGGESANAFRARVVSLLERLATTHEGKTVVAVCHGGIVWQSRRLLRSDDDRDVPVDNTSITEWLHEDGGWTLVRLNDVRHLEGTDLLDEVVHDLP
jgi:probable phosphoglycerate mutase